MTLITDLIKQQQDEAHKAYQEAYKDILPPELLAVRNTWYKQHISQTVERTVEAVVETIQRKSYYSSFGFKRQPEGFKSFQSPDTEKRIVDTDDLITILRAELGKGEVGGNE